MSDVNAGSTPEVTVPEGFRKSPYNQQDAYKRIEDAARSIVNEMTDEQRGEHTVDEMTESVMADFIANALGFAIYDDNKALLNAIFKKAQIQAARAMGLDLDKLMLAVAAPAGEA